MIVAVVTWHWAQDFPRETGGVCEFQYEIVPSSVAKAKFTLLLLME
jgi:hypothetical protein